MSLSREFNALTDKVINIAEFRAKLIAEGLNPDIDAMPSKAEVLRKMKALEAAGEDLSGIGLPAMYIPDASIAEIEQKALRENDEEIAFIVITAGLTAQTKADAYFDVFPAAKTLALFLEDKKLVEGYIRAAEACADYRGQVTAGALKNTMTAFEGIARKVEAKFNR